MVLISFPSRIVPSETRLGLCHTTSAVSRIHVWRSLALFQSGNRNCCRAGRRGRRSGSRISFARSPQPFVIRPIQSDPASELSIHQPAERAILPRKVGAGGIVLIALIAWEGEQRRRKDATIGPVAHSGLQVTRFVECVCEGNGSRWRRADATGGANKIAGKIVAVHRRIRRPRRLVRQRELLFV